MITYSDGNTEVLLGDRVSAKGLFSLWKKKIGKISYVPGISSKREDLEYGGIEEVGIVFDDGNTTAVYVDPDTNVLKENIEYLERGAPASTQKFPEDEM